MTRVVVVGAGWAGRVHAMAAAAAPAATLRSVAATSLGSAEVTAAEMGVRPVSIDAFSDGVDAAVIATPVTNHADTAGLALSRGLAVLVEGPIAHTLEAADQLIGTAETTGRTAAVAVNPLFAPTTDAMLQHREGAGPLRHMAIEYHQPPPEEGYRCDALSAGGVLLESGLACVGMAMALAGDDPVDGVAAALSSSRDDGADDVARVELRHRSELVTVIDCSWRADLARWSVEAASDDRVVRGALLPRSSVEVNGREMDSPSGASPTGDLLVDLGFAAQMDGFASALSGRGGRVCPAGFGRTLLEIAYAAYSSAGSGGTDVPMPYAGPRHVAPLTLWTEA